MSLPLGAGGSSGVVGRAVGQGVGFESLVLPGYTDRASSLPPFYSPENQVLKLSKSCPSLSGQEKCL